MFRMHVSQQRTKSIIESLSLSSLCIPALVRPQILVYVGIFILQGPFPSEPSTPLPSLGVLPPALHSLLESAVRDPRPLLMAWLIGNLGYAARETHNWYKDKFRSEYPASRKSLVPFLF